MQINTQANRNLSRTRNRPQASTLADDSSLKEKLAAGTGLLVPASGLAGAGAAAYYSSDVLHLGDSMPALYGTLAGGVVGAGVGFGVGITGSYLYDKFSGDDGPGKGMMGGMMVMGGTAVGAISGAIGGAFGTNPLVTVPATIIGGVAGLAATASLHQAVFGDM